MGTRFECVLGGFARPVQASQAAAIAESVERLVTEEHRRLSVFDHTSVMSLINRAAFARPIRLDPDLFALLDRCLGYSSDSEDAFDITAGSLMESCGFRGEGLVTVSHAGRRAYRLDPLEQSISLDSAETKLDLGGIAKGYVLDLAREELREHQTTSAIIHGGTSSVTTIGMAPGGKPWRVRLFADDPGSPSIDLTDRSLACSAPSGRSVDGLGHIMDTRAGRPAKGVDAACVAGPSAEVCEAWSTALVVAPRLIAQLPSGYESYLLQHAQWQHTHHPLTPARYETMTHA